MTECGVYNTVGSRCVQSAGHCGEHRSAYGAKWTDESNSRAVEWMLNHFKKGRD